jgi:PTH1 family peptidyl-tRNA hydrolase
MKLFVGLGNPGKKYQNTRHNLGQTIAKLLIEKHGEKTPSSIFAITDSFMNESGPSIQKILHFYKILPENLYLIHDDLDLGVGDYKIQFDRGPAGHHGVESVIQSLGTQAFWRFRVGIGKPTPPISPEDYVLTPFSATDKQIIDQTIDKIVTEIEKISGS